MDRLLEEQKVVGAIMEHWHDVRTAPPSTPFHDGWNAALLEIKDVIQRLPYVHNSAVNAQHTVCSQCGCIHAIEVCPNCKHDWRTHNDRLHGRERSDSE